MNPSSYSPTPPFTPFSSSSITENKSVRFSVSQSNSSLKHEIEEKQKLEKDNFDLKMKIYYLEESLRQQNSGESNQEVEDLRNENRQLRTKVQENAVDLEHRNTLLVKAKGAIEALKQEMERIRGQLDEKTHKEQRLHHQLRSASQEDEGLLNRIETLESENRHLTHTLQEKSEALHNCRVRLNELESSTNLGQISFAEVVTQRDGLKERCQGMRQQMDHLETELVDLRTEKEMWSLQGSEYQEMVEILQGKNEELQRQLGHQANEEERKAQTMAKKHENQLSQLKAAYEKELEDLKGKYQSTLTDIKEQMRAAHNDEVHELRSQGFGENYRMKEELLTRVHEKSEEIITLRGVVDLERSRVESLTKDLFLVKEELKSISRESDVRGKKLTELESSLSGNQQSALKTSELLSRTTEECKLLQFQLTEKTHQLETLTKELKESESKVTALRNELNSVSSENEYCKSLTTDLQETYRLNERYLNQIQQLQSESEILATQCSACEDQLAMMTKESESKERLLQGLSEEKRELQGKVEKLREDLVRREAELRSEKEHQIQLGSALTEQRNLTSSLQSELDHHRSLTKTEDLKWNQSENTLKNQKTEVERVCALFFQAIVKWDTLLVHTLDMFELSLQQQQGQGHHHADAFYTDSGSLSGSGYLPFSSQSQSLSKGSNPMQLLENPEQLLPSSLVLIERIQGKLERIERIRNLFEKKTKELIATHSARVSHSEDRLEILSHKLSSLQLQLQSALSQVLKDKRTRDQSYTELKALQESLLKGHAEQLREHEARATEVHLLYQSEQNKVSSLRREMAVLTEEIGLQREELSRVHEAEEMLNKLSNQFTVLSESNERMTQESEEKSRQLRRQEEELERAHEESEGMQSHVSRLVAQVEMRDKMLTEQEAVIAGLKVEMQQLQQRQIHPELERSIRESQDLLKTSLGRGGESSGGAGIGTGAIGGSSGSSSSHFVDRLTTLYQLTRQLVDETAEVWRSFDDRSQLEMGLRGELPLSGSHARATGLEQSLYDLLNSNAKLSLQLQTLASDFKRSFSGDPSSASVFTYGLSQQQQQQQRSLSPSSLFHTPLPSHSHSQSQSYSQSRGQSYGQSNGYGDLGKFSSSDLRIESHPASPLHRSIPSAALRSSTAPAETPRRDQLHVQFQLPSQPQTQSLSQARHFSSNGNGSNRSSVQLSHSQSSSRTTDLFTGTITDRGNSSRIQGGQQLPHTPTAAPVGGKGRVAEDYDWTHRSKLLFDSSPSSSPSLSSATPLASASSRRSVHLLRSSEDPTSSVSSPGAPARQSASRLSKLGQDLQSLATRLDSFDSKQQQQQPRVGSDVFRI